MEVKTLAPQFRGIPELDIDRKLSRDATVTLSPEAKLELRILWNLLKHLAANGWECRVAFDGDVSYMKSRLGVGVEEDGDDNVWESGRDPLTAKEVMEIAFNLDEVSLRFGKGAGRSLHGVYIVLGNGIDIVSDWNYSEDDADGFNAVMEAFDSDKFA